MFDRFIRYGLNLAGQTPALELVAVSRWDNEGGANATPAPSSVVATSIPAEQPAPSQAATIALDARQDKIMEIVSTDGRPPSAAQRMLEWRWVGLGAVLVTLAITAWMIFGRVTLHGVGAGLAIGVLMLVGASPVLAAGLLRGKEERAARRIARMERRPSSEP